MAYKKIKKAVYIPFKLGGGGRHYQVYKKGSSEYIKQGKYYVKIKKGKRRWKDIPK